MNKSRHTLLKIISVGVFFAVILSSIAANGLQKDIIIEDDFNSKKTLSTVNEDIWLLSGDSIKCVELEKPGKVLKFNGRGVTAETTLLMTDWYYEIKSLSFDFMIPKGAGDNDIFFFDFIDVDKQKDYCGDYSSTYGEPMCYETWPKTAFSSKAPAVGKWTDYGFSSDRVDNQWVSVKVEAISDNTANFYIAPRGKAFTKKNVLTISGRHTFLNSAVVFGDYQFIGYELDNIVLKTESSTLKENFEDDKNDLLKTVTINSDPDNFSFDIEEDGGVRKLAFNNSSVDDSIIATSELKSENEHLKDNDVVINATYNMTFQSGCSGEISYVFGLEENDSSPACENWAYVMNKSGGRIVYYDVDGNETVKAKHSYNSTDVNIAVTLTKSGKLTVTANGNAISASGVKKYDGFTGFSVRKEIKNTIYLDNVNIKNTYYNILTTKSISDDFSENRMGTPGHSDYAYNAEGGSFVVSDGELLFSGLSDNSFFGPAYQYETCELSFKLTSIFVTEDVAEAKNATYCDKWIGLDFGKNKSTVSSYGTYCTFAAMITHGEKISKSDWKEAGLFTYKDDNLSPLKSVEINRIKPIPADYFKDISYDGTSKQRFDIPADKAVCFKYIIDTDNIKLFMKRANEADYTLYAELDNVDTSGYFALCCTGYSFWTIDDFEIKNTSLIYNEAPPVEIEEITLPSLESRGIGVKDTGYEKEIKLNKNHGSSFNALSLLWIGIGVVAVLGLSAVSYLVIKKKKGFKEQKVKDSVAAGEKGADK